MPASLPGSIRAHAYRLVWEWCVGVLFAEPKAGTEREGNPETLEQLDSAVAELGHFFSPYICILGPTFVFPAVCVSISLLPASVSVCLCIYLYLSPFIYPCISLHLATSIYA